MRIVLIGSILLAATGCEKKDPLYCPMHAGAPGCVPVDGNVFPGDDMLFIDMAPGIDARTCFGADNGSVCLSQPPSGAVIFTNAGTLSTTAGVSTNPVCLATQPADWAAAGQPDACFIVGTSIAINAKLTVVGNRPLVLLSSTTITINADLDAAGHGITPGPGAPAPGTLCKPFTVTPVGSSTGGGGGAGGSFMSQGAPGGDGDSGNSANGVAGAPEGANPTTLRAGCNGQKGGDGQNAGNGGTAGSGGGAVYLIAGDAITVMPGRTINASGGGGGRAGRQGGGGGGGTGGMIWLHAPSITSTGATIMANGGGGASGGDDDGGSNGGGEAGNEPVDPTMPATGGSGTNDAGDGGSGYYYDGTARGATGGTAGASDRGGGGGGAGAGWIQSNIALSATSSPAPVIIP